MAHEHVDVRELIPEDLTSSSLCSVLLGWSPIWSPFGPHCDGQRRHITVTRGPPGCGS